MTWYLTDRTRLAARQDDLVLLDLVEGAYGCLAGAGAALGPATDTGAVPNVDPQLAALLAELGALSTTPPADPARLRPPPPPVRDLTVRAAERPRLGETAALLGAWSGMAHSFHGRSFARILATARDDRVPSAAPSGRAEALAAAFQAWRPWIPFQGACLYRSFLLRAALKARGERAWWVFGVQTWPFEAHCWLQVGEVVLDDTAERVAAYTPILAV